MSGNNRQSNRKSDNNDNKIKQVHTCFRVECQPIPKITSDGSPYGASCSEKDKSPLYEKSAVEDTSSGNLDSKETPNLLDEDSVSKKLKNISHESQENKRYDICYKNVSKAVKLKPSLAVINREKRNQLNRSKQGQNIIMLRPGMLLMKGYISFDDQVSIVKKCRELGLSDGGFYQPAYRKGTKLHLKMMCLGKNWDCQSKLYSDRRPSDNAKPPGIPDIFSAMVKKAIRDSNAYLEEKNPEAYAGQLIPSMSPDICIVNFYTESGKLGLHQDKDESPKTLKQGLPVVSFSIGDSAEFLYGDDRDVDKADKVILESGDVLIFGGKSRLVFHGVRSILPKTAPISLLEATDMIAGRLNLTFRSACIKETPNLLDEDSISKKLKNISHESQENKRYDICYRSVSKAVKLKPSLAVINREKRNQLNRSKQGQNIIVLRSGMVLMKGYISFNDQVSIVRKCRELGLSDGGFYQPGYRKMMCLGKNWDCQSKLYSDTRPSDNAKPPGISDIFSDMVKKAIRDWNAYLEEKNPESYAGQLIPSMSPNICIVNFYTESGKLGLHQDKNESPETLKQGLPVVSISIGDSAEFLYGDDRDIDKADKVILESGDLLIFGGKSRLVFHGVTSILPKTAPISLLDATDMIPGRLNLTFRRY